jgi:hypothetical protein
MGARSGSPPKKVKDLSCPAAAQSVRTWEGPIEGEVSPGEAPESGQCKVVKVTVT